MARKMVLFGYEIGKAAPRKGKTASGTGRKAAPRKDGKTTSRDRSGQPTKRPGKAPKTTRTAKETGAAKAPKAPKETRAAKKTNPPRAARAATATKTAKTTKRPAKTASQRGKAAPRQGPAKGGPPGDRQNKSRWHLPWFAGRQQAESAPGSSRPPAAVRVLIMVVAFAAMVAFAVVLARLTLQPSAASVPLTHNNLRPGDSLRAYLGQPAFRDTVKQIGGNILLGVPFGLLLPVLLPRARGLLRVGVATALVMVLVELVQGALVTGRAFDIDDVILNTGGALVGYLLLGRRIGRAIHPRRVHWWHRFTKRRTAG